MDEATRQAYLDSMGIQSYFPRYILPAAKESEQFEWLYTETSEAGLKAEPTGQGAQGLQGEQRKTVKPEIPDFKPSLKSTSPADSAQTAEKAAETKTLETDKSVSSRAEAEEVRFQLAIIQVNDEILVLALLPYMHASNSLNATQKQLFHNIFNALYAKPVTLNLDIKPFRWPFSEAPHIEKDASAAKASLSAYLQQLQNRMSFNRLLVMGEKIENFLDFEKAYEITICRSLDEMLKMPQLKREVWQQLNKLSVDS
jgi:hypothetical protein